MESKHCWCFVEVEEVEVHSWRVAPWGVHFGGNSRERCGKWLGAFVTVGGLLEAPSGFFAFLGAP